MSSTAPVHQGITGRPLGALDSLISRREYLIPLFFFLLFLAASLPGIAWGAPAIWHPDEVVLRAVEALDGDWDHYEANYNHPFLPQNAMYLLGRVVMALGADSTGALVAARVLSAVLLGLSIVMVYYITRRLGGGLYAAGLSALMLVGASEMLHNAHFAHTDAYVAFFSTLVLFCLVHYEQREGRLWLYAAFLAAGLALSSKYNSLLLVLAPLIVYFIKRKADLARHWLAFFEPLVIGIGLWLVGFGLGTPKFLTWNSWFLKRAIPAFLYNGAYGQQPGSSRGIITQYPFLAEGLGLPLFLLFVGGLAWAIFRLIRTWKNRESPSPHWVVLLCILLLDLPIMLSYNQTVRFFLPLIPMLGVLAALMVQEVYMELKQRGQAAWLRGFAALLGLILLFSLARTASVMLLFVNDSRYAAGQFLETLPVGSSLEETFYPPQIPRGRFSPEHNYPLYFLKTIGDSVPDGGKYDNNQGESGLVERGTDYLLVDEFTAERFNDAYTCGIMQAECDFFKELASGESEYYRLLADFDYALPIFLPQLEVTFVNPEIRIYERIK